MDGRCNWYSLGTIPFPCAARRSSYQATSSGDFCYRCSYAEKSPGSIYLIPVKLDDCEIPDLQLPELGISLRAIHWLDYWKEDGFDRLVSAIVTSLGKAESQQPHPPPLDLAKIKQLDFEIEHRLKVLPILLLDVFTFTQMHTVKGSVQGKAEEHPRLGKLGTFAPLFPKFGGMNLFALIWELQQLVPEVEKAKLTAALESAKELPVFLGNLVLLVPVGKEDSKWQMDRKQVSRFGEVLRGFDIGRWNFRPVPDESQ